MPARHWRAPLQETPRPIGGYKNATLHGFTFHEQLDDLSLIHMNGRVYDPSIGRFMSADPYVQAPYFSQSLNRYSYVFNNPLSYTDPSGFITAADGSPADESPGTRPRGPRVPEITRAWSGYWDYTERSDPLGEIRAMGGVNFVSCSRPCWTLRPPVATIPRTTPQPGPSEPRRLVMPSNPVPMMLADGMSTVGGIGEPPLEEPLRGGFSDLLRQLNEWASPRPYVTEDGREVRPVTGMPPLPGAVGRVAAARGLIVGGENLQRFASLNAARAAARQYAGLGDDAVNFVQEIGPLAGRVTGRMSADRLRGWRIDFDPRKGFHVNWWDRTGGAARADWKYGANIIEGGTLDDFWAIMQHFP